MHIIWQYIEQVLSLEPINYKKALVGNSLYIKYETTLMYGTVIENMFKIHKKNKQVDNWKYLLICFLASFVYYLLIFKPTVTVTTFIF